MPIRIIDEVNDPKKNSKNRRPRSKSKGSLDARGSIPSNRRDRLEQEKIRRRNQQKKIMGSKPTEPRGNPAVVETFEDARENRMINRDVPTMKHGGEAVVRGMGAAIKGGKFEGVF
jgi:hypothetical protein